MALLALALLSGHAAAFCGAFIGDASGPPSNVSSRMALATSGDFSTLTLFNDVQAGAGHFGLVIPVPPGLDRDNLRLASTALMDRMDRYTAPRLVDYTCEDLHEGVVTASVAAAPDDAQGGAKSSAPTSTSSLGCGTNDWVVDAWQATDTGPDSGGVETRDEFDLGEYTAWVLAADDGAALAAWMADAGLEADALTAARLQEYVDQGTEFLALRVDLEAAPNERTWLTPLQIGYPGATWTLPLRLGAAASRGVQDLVLYVITDPGRGEVGISNYPELAAPEADCMVPEDTEIATWYEHRFTAWSGLPADPVELMGGESGFRWLTEYTWGSGKCDPCPDTGPLVPEDLEGLGFAAHAYGYQVTRLHLRYTPDAVTQDLVLYPTGLAGQEQLKYIAPRWEMQSSFPACDAVQFDDPGTCWTSEYWERLARGEIQADPPTSHGPATLACGGRRLALLFPLWIVAWRRRR